MDVRVGTGVVFEVVVVLPGEQRSDGGDYDEGHRILDEVHEFLLR